MILVTGAMGAIGCWTVRRLLDEGHPFLVYDWRADYTLLSGLEGKFGFVQGDILDQDRLLAVAREAHVDRILHLAALMPPACEADPQRGFQVNLLGALKVFDVAREIGAARVVFMSSKAQYGVIDGKYGPPTFEPVTEDYRGQPVDVYGSTKRAVEDAARHYRRLFDMDLIALRLGSTYGPGKLQRHGAVGLKSQIVESGFKGEPFAVPHPDLADDTIYNRDVAKAIVLACFAPKSEHWQFNVCTEQMVSLRAFAEEVKRLCPNHRITLDGTPAQQKPSTSGRFSAALARNELGFTPDFPGIKGIPDYLEYLRNQPHR